MLINLINSVISVGRATWDEQLEISTAFIEETSPESDSLDTSTVTIDSSWTLLILLILECITVSGNAFSDPCEETKLFELRDELELWPLDKLGNTGRLDTKRGRTGWQNKLI